MISSGVATDSGGPSSDCLSCALVPGSKSRAFQPLIFLSCLSSPSVGDSVWWPTTLEVAYNVLVADGSLGVQVIS